MLVIIGMNKLLRKYFDFLKEYEDIFFSFVLEFKGIKGDLGEINIIFKANSRLVKHQLYHLNLQVKEKVNKEIHKMMVVSLIFLVDEAEWINHIFIQDKKDSNDI